MTPSLYDLTQVAFSYETDHPVLSGLDLSIRDGDFLGIIGPNGAGKSTLLHLLSGRLKPQSGRIHFQDRPIAEWSRLELARRLAVVPQREDSVFAFSVQDIVLMGRYPHHTGVLGFEDESDYLKARGAIEEVGLKGFENRPIGKLSGGERQLVLLARALSQDTPILLLDEPTASLDFKHQRQVFSILDALNRQSGKTILAISHDINLAAMYCPELAILSEGRLIARGKPQDVLDPVLLSQVYQVPIEVYRDSGKGPFVNVRK